jgi:hypothetical protein
LALILNYPQSPIYPINSLRNLTSGDYAGKKASKNTCKKNTLKKWCIKER